MSGGMGGSQHLHKRKFFSNGIVGGMMPIAAGIGLALKLNNSEGIAVVFIGDGAWGQGIVYESLNIISKWNLPVLVVCENNFYSQSTAQKDTLAGNILERSKSFEIEVVHSNIWDLQTLFTNAESSIESVRKERRPIVHVVDMYRLCAHSKGDDYRSIAEIDRFKEIDPIEKFKRSHGDDYNKMLIRIEKELEDIVKQTEAKKEANLILPREKKVSQLEDWTPLIREKEKISDLIYKTLLYNMNLDDRIILLGEDIVAPYGGAFRITRDLSEHFPSRVYSTPISEAAITGVSCGLSLGGFRPILEIMFGDFITLCLDQLINHIAKFPYVYEGVFCPVVIRVPMGGGLGYGPTHSQTLDKLFLGIDGVQVIALNCMISPRTVYEKILNKKEKTPTIIIENKTDYNVRNFEVPEKYNGMMRMEEGYPVIRISPESLEPDVTIVTYGGVSKKVLECLYPLFKEFEICAEVLIFTKINPMTYEDILQSVSKTHYLFVVEEGSMMCGWGSEIVSTVCENVNKHIVAKRISSLECPIPACRNMEEQVLVNKERIIKEIVKGIGS